VVEGRVEEALGGVADGQRQAAPVGAPLQLVHEPAAHGPDALQHVESLCAIDPLDMVQWMPGEGYYDDDWSELNSRIDSMGKGHIFQSYYKLTAADIQRIWETYASRKLFFHVSPEVLAELPWQ